MQEPQGKAVERWVKELARKQHLTSSQSFDLVQVVKLLDTKLQRRMMLARTYVEQDLPYANDWIDAILNNKQLPPRASPQAKGDLVEKLLDQALATDLVVSINNNQGQECVIAIDVTCDPTKEQSKLNTIQGKREDGDPGKFNRNQNLPNVRKQLGIDKHIVLVLNHKQLPQEEVIVNELYAAANLPAQTRVINLRAYTPQATLANLVPSAVKASMQQQNSTLIGVLERLPDNELVATIRRVQTYLANKPPQPPTSAEQTGVQQKVDKLQSQILSLWQNQASLVETVEQMQKNPLRMWNKKYDVTFTELEQTMELLKKTTAQKDQKQNQLQAWAKQGETYQAWLNAPQTKQIYQVTEALKHPAIQVRINQIQNKLQQKQTQLDTRRQQSQRRDRGQGLGL